MGTGIYVLSTDENLRGDWIMNKHQAKGAAKEVAGKLQKKVGKATANGTMAAKGMAREMAGKAQKAYGNVKASAGAKATTAKARGRVAMADAKLTAKRTASNARANARAAANRSRERDIDRHAH